MAAKQMQQEKHAHKQSS